MRIKLIVIVITLLMLMTSCAENRNDEQIPVDSIVTMEENTKEEETTQEMLDSPETVDMHGLDSDLYWIVMKHGSAIEKSYLQGDTISIDDLMPIFSVFEMMDGGMIRSLYAKYEVEYGTIRIPKQLLMDEYFNEHFSLKIETSGSRYEDPEDAQYFIITYATRHPWIDIIDYTVDGNIYTLRCEYGYVDFDFYSDSGDVCILHQFELVIEYENAEHYRYLSHTILSN